MTAMKYLLYSVKSLQAFWSCSPSRDCNIQETQDFVTTFARCEDMNKSTQLIILTNKCFIESGISLMEETNIVSSITYISLLGVNSYSEIAQISSPCI